MKKTLSLLISCVVAAAIVGAGVRAGMNPGNDAQACCDENSKFAPEAVEVPMSIFYNRDSIDFYARKAFLEEDAKGLFVMGAATYLQRQGDMPKSIATMPLEDADDMLMLSAGKHYQPAIDLINCLRKHGQWRH